MTLATTQNKLIKNGFEFKSIDEGDYRDVHQYTKGGRTLQFTHEKLDIDLDNNETKLDYTQRFKSMSDNDEANIDYFETKMFDTLAKAIKHLNGKLSGKF